MFREMRRKKQLLSKEETIEILKSCTSGVLGVIGDDGYPYTVPVSYALKDDKIFIHSAKEGCYYRFSLSKINRYLLSTDYRNCCRLRAFVVLSRHSFFLHPRYWCCKFYENSHSRTSFTAWSSMIRFFVWLPYSSRLVHTLSITLAVPALY
jgi:hypothetical protein